MEIKELQYFKTVVEEGSILKASIKLHIAQPPLSRMMKQLEEKLDTKLFERGKKITLTETGKLLYERASSMIELKDNTIKDIIALEKRSEQTLQLGIVSSSTNLLYEHSIEQFHQKYPAIHFNIKEANTFQLVELLNQKIIDMAIVRTPFDFSPFNAQFLPIESMVLLSKNSLPSTISFNELHQKPIIIYRRFKDLFIELFKAYQIQMNVIAEVDDAKTAILLCNTGLGYAIVPESTSKTFSHLHLSKSFLKEKRLETSLGIISRKNEALKPIYQNLIDILLNGMNQK
ncbi:MAG: LysR family transcriptional regulator [Anaeroplasmataceae bacterium]|nr:LysR family transcriptional regulator [Anaeroplasmataceae bacterium]